MLAELPSVRDLPDRHAHFFRERADGGDEAAGRAGPRPGAVGRLHVAELTELVHGEEVGHTCRRIRVMREDVPAGFRCLVCTSSSASGVHKDMNSRSRCGFADVIPGRRRNDSKITKAKTGHKPSTAVRPNQPTRQARADQKPGGMIAASNTETGTKKRGSLSFTCFFHKTNKNRMWREVVRTLTPFPEQTNESRNAYTFSR